MKLQSVIHWLFKRKSVSGIDDTPQSNVTLSRYMGRWYEQARFENWFEAGMEQVYTNYIECRDGSISVVNHGITDKGINKEAKGKAYLVSPGELRVSFVPPYWWFKAPYRILYTAPDYSAALVSGEGDEHLWLLTRQKHPDSKCIATLVREARLRGFDTSRLRYTSHGG